MDTKNITNQFFDINKFPPHEGMLVFPISMSRISNESQNAKKYFDHIKYINPSKANKTNKNAKFGVIFIYGDFLYLYSDEKASILKRRYTNQINLHKNNFQNLLKNHPHLIQNSFSYKVWNQFYLDCERFNFYFSGLKKIYKTDKLFQKYIKEDFKSLDNNESKFNENQIDFFVEEHLLFYLISKGQMKLENDFINNHEKWILIAYPGKPLKAHIYLHQLNPFKLLNNKNKYENSWYDLKEKKLYDFSKIELETYNP